MKLNYLLAKTKAVCIMGQTDIEISSLIYDTRAEIKKGSLFVAIKGFVFDAHSYIPEAIRKGASAVIVNEDFTPTAEQNALLDTVTVITVTDTRHALATVSAAYFGYPAEKMTLIGITGTKGKTTTANMIKSVLEKSGAKVGMIGTLGAFIGQEKYPTKNTTPESYELHRLFSEMVSKGCTYAVMEVSSQALLLHRTAGIAFDHAVYLNLSPDHISASEHANIDEYAAAKKLLFSQCKTAIVNMDDPMWEYMTEHAPRVITTSRENEADFFATDIKNLWNREILGTEFMLSGRLANRMAGSFALNLPGKFNVENALIAIATAELCGINKKDAEDGLTSVFVKGRTQLLKTPKGYATFIIDYAHNALSMESLLSMLKAYEPKRLICLFGGGGNKPKQRRFDMGEIAGKYASLTVLTMDNPRFEKIEDINNDIIVGLNIHNGKYITIIDREEAIVHLMENTSEGDIVALIGKGHEEYQEIEGQKYYFSEEKVVSDYFKNHS